MVRGWCHSTELTLPPPKIDKVVHSGDSVLFPGPNFTPPGVPAETYELTLAQFQAQCPSHRPSFQVYTLLLAMESILPFSGKHPQEHQRLGQELS